mmetsp:Transcript_4229/g.6070  ORF Transcript_4229/g.6070 Transcript_4229/m.6070 type:complete len:81 (-) Transcript_4229:12-254(-)
MGGRITRKKAEGEKEIVNMNPMQVPTSNIIPASGRNHGNQRHCCNQWPSTKTSAMREKKGTKLVVLSKPSDIIMIEPIRK